ncbi:sialidase family protein [Chitinophaga barathri]|uniref:exo-alpha-sialidase n=1 Tax=Chitinophaga barathri TaxID=1647451 RepID=A0A3N4MCG3_9BACT|nr:sialidase family protein [Chitinophaga barathri]RPD41218.1 exo-alpha-sialidase [Chitinophaga barathri]
MVNIKKILTTILLLCALFAKGQDSVRRTVLWKANEDNILAHFVYGLAVTTKGTILAFAEARITESADDGAHHIALKRSTDGGNTFSSKTLMKSENGQSWTNPTIVQDNKTNELFLFYALNHRNDSTQVFYMTSKDDGESWSGATEITRLFDGNQHGWTFHLPGPGHGIQLKNKRLVVPVWHRKSISFAAAERKYGVNCIYSDDHGKTWKLGGDAPVGEFNESQIVEKKNGDIMLIGRTHTSQNGSFQARVISKDKGLSWSSPIVYDKGLAGTVCDIGLTRYSLKPNIILVSQPANPGKRRDLTIRLSKDEGETWPVSKLLQEGSATYSDLAVLPDKSIICLYGHGGAKHMPDTVSLVRFSLKWLLENSK